MIRVDGEGRGGDGSRGVGVGNRGTEGGDWTVLGGGVNGDERGAFGELEEIGE